MLATINRIVDLIIDSLAKLAIIFIVFSMVAVCSDVIARYVFNRSLFWAFESVTYSMTWMAVLGAAWVLKKEGHVVLDSAINLFSPRRRALIIAITSLLCALVTFVIAWFGADIVYDHFQRGSITAEKYMELPLWPLLSVMPAGFLMFSIQFLRRSWKHLKESRKAPEEELVQKLAEEKEKHEESGF